jgi:hypothetical protein
MSNEISNKLNCILVGLVIIILYLLNVINKYKTSRNRLIYNNQPCERFTGYSTYDGSTKIELSDNPLSYIQFDKTNNTILVPNSNSYYSHLLDTEIINCNETDLSSSDAKLQLEKSETMVNNNYISNLTSSRYMIDNNRSNKFSMIDL